MQKRTQEELDWLYLMLCAGAIAPQALQELVNTYGSATDILNAGRRAVVPIVGEEASRNLFSDRYRQVFEATCEWLEKTPLADVIVWSDKDYPQELLRAGLAPSVLWMRGCRELLSRPKILVTGTDRPDEEGKCNALEFARALGKKGQCVVTGLTSGIETEAFNGAHGTEGGALVVQLTGANRLYPKENRDCFIKALESDLIVSALPLATGYDESNRAGQLELMTALSAKVLVVQSPLGSPVLSAAKSAAELGRDVFAIPGSIHNPLYKGNLHLIKQGAQLVETVADILV